METIAEAVNQALREFDREHRQGIRLRKAGANEARQYPDLYRAWAGVDKRLQRTLWDLGCGKPTWPLYLWGDVGTGKTRAVLAFCDEVHFARYWTVQDVLDSMIAQRPPWERGHWCWGVDGPDLAVLDELGTGMSQFEYDAVKRFSDWREGKPTIYVSNHSSKKLTEVYDRRIQSRVTCGIEFELTGPDRRFE